MLKPSGILAVWTYGVLVLDDARIQARVQRFYHDTVGPSRPPERHHVATGYRELPLARSMAWPLSLRVGRRPA